KEIIKKDIMTYVIFILVFLFIIFQPIYLWSSGVPQVADILGVLLIVLTSIKYKSIKKDLPIYIILFFMFYTLTVNLFWGLILQEQLESILNSSWYIYNILIMLTFIVILKNNPTILKLVSHGIIFIVIIELIVIIVFPGTGLRATGTFNNPNQLGYFSILYLSLFFLIINQKKDKSFVFWIITIASLIISFYSLSKGSMLAMFILIIIQLFIMLKQKKHLKTFFSIMLIILLIMVTHQYFEKILDESELYLNVENRILDIGKDTDDNPAGRGYDRILNHPEYLFLGAGEVSTKRFDSFDGEIHSTFGNLLFSYGIIGLSLFLLLLFNIIKNNNIVNYYMLLPLFLYSLTHNGLRNPVFWIILAFIYVLKQKEAERINGF